MEVLQIGTNHTEWRRPFFFLGQGDLPEALKSSVVKKERKVPNWYRSFLTWAMGQASNSDTLFTLQ